MMQGVIYEKTLKRIPRFYSLMKPFSSFASIQKLMTRSFWFGINNPWTKVYAHYQVIKANKRLHVPQINRNIFLIITVIMTRIVRYYLEIVSRDCRAKRPYLHRTRLSVSILCHRKTRILHTHPLSTIHTTESSQFTTWLSSLHINWQYRDGGPEDKCLFE